MEENLKLFNWELERIGITKEDFWILSIWKNQPATAQAEYKATLAVKFIKSGYNSRVNPSGSVTFTHPQNKFEFTLS
jgi:hypothetical protein